MTVLSVNVLEMKNQLKTITKDQKHLADAVNVHILPVTSSLLSCKLEHFTSALVLHESNAGRSSPDNEYECVK